MQQPLRSSPDPERVQAFARAIIEAGLPQRVAEIITDVRDAFSGFVQANPDFFASIRQFAEDFKNLPERLRRSWSDAASNGWYPNAETSIVVDRQTAQDRAARDAFMIEHLRNNWETLTNSILLAYPQRRNILECAFQLHIEGRYIASIPLFFAQADGIAAQDLGAHLFTDKKEREAKLADMSANSEEFTAALLHVLGLSTQFHAGISKATQRHKSVAPNRNGILHGSRRHLDYGTEVNSFKSFSLLAFVVFALSELTPNPSIEGALSGLRPPSAPHVKR